MTNEEILLRALNGESLAEGATFQPQNNTQAYLAYLVGLITDLTLLPAPRTNEEALLYKACVDGIGGKLPELTNPAIALNILDGKEAIDADGNIIAGSMPDYTNMTVAGQYDSNSKTIRIPLGYHDGASGVSIITDSEVVTPSAETQEITPRDGALLEKVVVNGDANLIPGNIKKGVSVFGVNGTLDGGNKIEIHDASYLFYKGARLDVADSLIALSSGVVSTTCMFQDCKGLERIDLSGLDTSRVTEMACMFKGCNALKTLNLGAFDTSNVTTMDDMFNGCKVLNSINLSGFDTSKVTDMSGMFYGCSNLGSLNVSIFNTSNATNMNGMFAYCNKLAAINVSNFDTSNVKDMGYMFSGCNKITSLNLSNFDTSNVTNMSSMFSNCSEITSLDFSNFDTSNVTNMSSMFSNCTKLVKIIGFSAMNKAGITIGFPDVTSATYRQPLKRLTFRTDVPDGKYAIRSKISIRYCSFERDGIVEMFNTLTDVSSLGLSSSYTTITITGNPCITGTLPNGTACDTLTDEDKAIATSKGWTLVT